MFGTKYPSTSSSSIRTKTAHIKRPFVDQNALKRQRYVCGRLTWKTTPEAIPAPNTWVPPRHVTSLPLDICGHPEIRNPFTNSTYINLSHNLRVWLTACQRTKSTAREWNKHALTVMRLNAMFRSGCIIYITLQFHLDINYGSWQLKQPRDVDGVNYEYPTINIDR